MTRKVGQVSTSSLELTEGRGPGCGSAASSGWTWWPRSGSMWDLRSREAYVPGALRLLDPVCSIDPESANTWRAYVRNPRPNSHTSGALSGSSRSCRGSGRRDPFPCLCRRTRLLNRPTGRGRMRIRSRRGGHRRQAHHARIHRPERQRGCTPLPDHGSVVQSWSCKEGERRAICRAMGQAAVERAVVERVASDEDADAIVVAVRFPQDHQASL